MKSIDPNNMLAVQEITKRKREMNEHFTLAETLEASHQYIESLRLYGKALRSSFHSEKSLKVTIMNENIDQDNRHKISEKIAAVKIKIQLQRFTS